MGKTYLIDYENIKDFSPLVERNEENKQYLFYSNACPTISIDVISTLKHIEFLKVIRGNQSLDMCLASYLGLLIANCPEDEYIIISNDCGYDTIINFWRKRNIKISRAVQISEKAQHNTVISKTLNDAGIKSLTNGEISSIVARLYKQKNGKHKIYLELIKKYGKATGTNYYHVIQKAI